ncbi:SDR family oxidoreductase [Catalinimonas niigatensis]|uniref:SDR family oxidoreductase n=1 Tax=Catalinimonas niigatensis TaxID=1397264 RepID=UPI002664ED6F|nr:SDR family oxidoreductase [Catalinimonas niigatensis]WPP50296.1 SDR family oxidoreductase [Catalinimonas niigatensis]
MNILVAGSHGKTGLQIVELLVEREHNVLAMIRNDAQSDEMQKLGATPFVANLEGDVEFAVEGAEAVIFAAGSGPDTGEDKTWAIDRDGAIKLIESCERNGVARFILLSSVGTDAPDQGPEKLQTYLKAKAESEKRLKRSNLNYTIVRPGMLNDDPESNHIIVQESLRDKRGQISRADVALSIVEALENTHTYRKTFEIIGGGNMEIEKALNTL